MARPDRRRAAAVVALGVVALLAAAPGPVAAFKAEDFKVGREGEVAHVCVCMPGGGEPSAAARGRARKREGESIHFFFLFTGSPSGASKNSHPAPSIPPTLAQKCADAGFCAAKRGVPGPGYTLSKASLTKTAFTATLTPTAPPPPGTTGELALSLTPFAGAVRVHITEAAPAAAAARYEVPGVLPADLTSAWGGAWGPGSAVAKQPGGRTLLALPASAGPGWVVVEAAPFALSLHLGPTPPAPGAAPAIAFNGGGFLDVQPLRNLGGNAGGGGGPAENETWAETWKGHTDERKAGPQAVALDLTFPAGATLYGLPERAAPAALRPTAGPDPANATASVDAEPYRLYNLDVFEYELDNPMATPISGCTAPSRP